MAVMGRSAPVATIQPASAYAANLAAANTGYTNTVAGYQQPVGGGANVINGGFQFDRGGAGQFAGLGGSPQSVLANLGSNYATAYNAYANNVQNQTNAINAGYGQTAQAQADAQRGVANGYGALSSSVLGGIAGIGTDQRAIIDRTYAQQAGRADQNLINSGLGNSTVRTNAQRGIGFDQALAQNNLANSIAQTKAGYESQIGQAGLGYQGQAVRDNTALSLDQLHWMNSVTNLPPDASQYSTLAQQAGAAIQSEANRAQVDRLAGQNAGLGDQIRQAGVIGGSGGLAMGTGGILPKTPYNSGQGSVGQTPGGGGAGGGGSFFQSPYGSRPVGTGGGGAMQQATGGGGYGGAWESTVDWEQGIPAAASAFAAGAAGGYGGGWDPNSNPFGFGSDFTSTYEDPGAFYGLEGGGLGEQYDVWSNPFGFGDDYSSTGNYDVWNNPFGFGGDYTTDWGGGLDNQYDPNAYTGAYEDEWGW